MNPSEVAVDCNLTGAFKTSVGMDLGGGRKLKLMHASSSKLSGLEFSSKNWTIGTNSKQDSFMEWRSDTDVGKLKVRQTIPAGKWELAPSPVCTLNTKIKTVGKFRDDYELSYDFLTRTGRATEFLEYNGKHSIKVTADSKTGAGGATIVVATKPKMKICRMVGVSNAPHTGPLVLYEADPTSCIGIKSEYSVRKQEMCAGLTLKASAEGKTQLRMDAKFDKTGLLKPSLSFGVKFDMK